MYCLLFYFYDKWNMIDMCSSSSSSSVLVIAFLMDECDTCYCFYSGERDCRHLY